MTHVFFVRHARPNYDNHDDFSRELSPQGMADRALVTRFLADKQIDAVLSSPYKRAVDTVKAFADQYGFPVQTIDGFRERRVDSVWVEDFTAFAQKQWADFSYRLPGGESLQEVQDRNIAALNAVLEQYAGKNIVIGSHGTALSTIIHFYDPSFGYAEFDKVRHLMPWIVEFTFDAAQNFLSIQSHELL